MLKIAQSEQCPQKLWIEHSPTQPKRQYFEISPFSPPIFHRKKANT
jgi:hypothetical protein